MTKDCKKCMEFGDRENRCASVIDSAMEFLIFNDIRNTSQQDIIDTKITFLMYMILCNIYSFSKNHEKSLEMITLELRNMYNQLKPQITH